MKPTSPFAAVALAFALFLPCGLLAQPAPAGPEVQLREALRAATLQLRTAQGELVAVTAEKDGALAEKDDLAKRLESLTRQAAADQSAARLAIANLTTQVAQKDAEAARLADKLKRSQDERDGMSTLAETRAAELARNEIVRVELERSVTEMRGLNRELFRIGTEVLDRYAAFGLGDAIVAREPFTKITRVKLQNIIQDYREVLEDNRAKLPPVSAAKPVAATVVTQP